MMCCDLSDKIDEIKIYSAIKMRFFCINFMVQYSVLYYIHMIILSLYACHLD